MSGTLLNHLRSMKRRMASNSTHAPMSPEEKIDMVEKGLNSLRKEMSKMMKIILEILTVKNEQMSVHKKLMDRCSTLMSRMSEYDSEDHDSQDDCDPAWDNFVEGEQAIPLELELTTESQLQVEPQQKVVVTNADSHVEPPTLFSAGITSDSLSTTEFSQVEIELEEAQQGAQIPRASTVTNSDDSEHEGCSPDDIGNNETEFEAYHGDFKLTRKRRRGAMLREWKRSKNAQLRMHGERYTGYQAEKISIDGKTVRKVVQTNPRCPRELKAGCKSKKCAASIVLKCNAVDEKLRRKIFEKFWKDMDWGQKRVYICSLVKQLQPIQRTSTAASRRQTTFSYYLNTGSETIKVCKQMFLSTFGLGEHQVYGWINKQCISGMPSKSSTPSNAAAENSSTQPSVLSRVKRRQNQAFSIPNKVLYP